MSADFETINREHLRAGLAWLRALLAARAEMPHDEPRRRWPFSRHNGASAPTAAPDAAEAARAFETASRAQPAPALVMLAGRLCLSGFESNMLLLTVAPELDPDMPALIAQAHGDPVRRAPTFALGMDLFGDAAWDALAPERPLRAARLLEVHQSGAVPLIAAPLRIDERIAAYIKGINYLDERLAAMVAEVPAPDSLPPSQQAAARALCGWLADGAPHRVVELLGADAASKRDVLAHAAARSGHRVFALAAHELPVQPQDAEQFVRLWAREALLLPLVLLVEEAEADLQHELRGEAGVAHNGAPLRLLGRLPGLVCIATRQVLGQADHVALPVEPPLPAERRALWRAALAARGYAVPDGLPFDRLSGEFSLSASRIAAIAMQVQPQADGEDGVAAAWNASVAQAAATLDGVAQRMAGRATLEDVQLPPHDKTQLERLVAHARQRSTVLAEYGFEARAGRGLGLAALFHGESGTGKTLAAEAVANALAQSLFRIDLSAVVSKYIGETSKNLRRVFDAAEGGGAVLLFDEADAVFGKRSEVKDSHDRYANIDINYLLTRMESFGGVAILATNMKHALDPAFVRRLRFVVGFPFPGVPERRSIWARVFPDVSRLDAADPLDLDRLARFALTGGSIFNAALAAAHGAASEREPIGMRHVLDAIRWELRKMERPVAESEFGWRAQPGVREAR